MGPGMGPMGGAINLFLPEMPDCGGGMPTLMPAMLLSLFLVKGHTRRRRDG